MPSTFPPGTEVRTARFGVGTVHESRPDSALVFVTALGIIVKVPLAELTFLNEAPPAEGTALPRKTVQTQSDRSAVLRCVEALRFGVVPREGIDRLTVGYDELREWVVSQLPGAGGKPRVAEVCGQFGSGKSHAMAAVRHVAASEHYLTAHVEVNGRDVTLADPGRLLFHLWATVAAEDLPSATPLLKVNLWAKERGPGQARERIKDFDRVSANFETLTVLKEFGYLDHFEHELDELLAGSDTLKPIDIRRRILADFQSPELKERAQPTRIVGLGVHERPKDFADCLFGYAALASRAGYKGLVVTLDEFEVEYKAMGRSHISHRVIELLEVLTQRVSASSDSAQGPLAIFIATVGQEGELGDSYVQELVEATNSNSKVLRPWSAKDLIQLASKIHELYRDAYAHGEGFSVELARQVERRIEKDDADRAGHVRAFIKGFVAELDVRYGPPAA